MKNKLALEFLHSALEEDALKHHGIKNMHWGVKNGPPYPLDKKVSARIKKGKNEKARYSKKELEDMRKNPNARRYRKQKVGITHLGAPNERFYKQVNNFTDLPELAKTSFRTKRTIMNVSDLIDQGGGEWVRRLNRPGHKATFQDVRDCNYDRQNTSGGYTDKGLNNNCGQCSATMFLRGLGYDVQAGKSAHGSLISSAQYWFDGATAYKQKGAVNVYQQMTSFGNQGKGMLSIRHKTGGGHAVYFQNERGSDGKVRPVIYDGQIGKKYDTVAGFLKAENADMSQFSTITRLDGSTPNWKHLSEDNVCRMNFRERSRNLVNVAKPTRSDYGRNYFDTNFGWT